MTASKSLPARPSLDSLRKQAKKLARAITAGDAAAIARARAHLPNVDLPLTQRNAQLVIAREYGYARSHARGLLQLFRRKGLLPRTLTFFAALGDIDAVRTTLLEDRNNPAVVTEAFTVACGFKQEAIASHLLDRALALDPELGAHVASVGRLAFVKYFIDNRPRHVTEVGLWKAFVMEQVGRAVSSYSGHETSVASPGGDNDLTAFLRLLHREPWLL